MKKGSGTHLSVLHQISSVTLEIEP
jgi:hypothetical protein